MLPRVCCLLLSLKSPKLVFVALITIGALITACIVFFADFRNLFHSSLFSTPFEKAAAFHRNAPRYRPHRICPSEGLNTSVTFFVISSPENILRRQVIRSTWGSPDVTKSLQLGVVYVVGDAKDNSVARLVDWEAEVYGDVLQPPFLDTYESLSLKTLSGLKWVLEYCPKSKYVIKVDDDVFVNVYALKRFLSDQKINDTSLMCLVWNNMPVIHRKGTKWSVTKDQYNGTVYPTYCSGSAYIMSIPVGRSLHNASHIVPTFWLEDVFVTGILARHANVTHKQIGYVYAFKSRNMHDLAEGKIIFAHLDDDKSVPEARMWEEVFAYENNKPSTLKSNLQMRGVGT